MNIIASFLILIAVVLTVLIFIVLIGWWRGADNILFPGLGLIVATPAIIVLLLILNIAFVIAAALLKPRQEAADVRNTIEQKIEYPNDIFSGCGNGTLTTSLGKNPDNYDAVTDRALEVCLNYDDLESLYNAMSPDRIKHTADEIPQTIYEEHEKTQRQFGSQYPMIGRIKDMYADYIFSPEEVKKLREECLKLRAEKQGAAADLALRKLIYTCGEALKDDFYLEFSGD